MRKLFAILLLLALQPISTFATPPISNSSGVLLADFYYPGGMVLVCNTKMHIDFIAKATDPDAVYTTYSKIPSVPHGDPTCSRVRPFRADILLVEYIGPMNIRREDRNGEISWVDFMAYRVQYQIEGRNNSFWALWLERAPAGVIFI